MSAHLAAADYITLAAFVVLSVAVGLWASKGAAVDARSYFLAGRSAPTWITAISLLSGITSGISFLGIPGYSYSHGICMLALVPSYFLTTAFTVYVSIPFFARPELNLSTAYEYLEKRFSRPVRQLVAASFVIRVVIYMGFVLYAPAIAIEAVCGVSFYSTVVTCGLLATAYTTKGGMSSVIYTDFLASLVMMVGVVICISYAISGIRLSASEIDAGENKNSALWRIASANDKLVDTHTFFDFTPLKAYDFWSLFLGGVQTMAAQAGTDQIAVQRYLAVENVRESQKVAAIGSFLNCLISIVLPLLGVAVFAYYESLGMDPVHKGIVTSDQIFPYFFTTALPTGLAGVLMAALFATTMSVFSGGLNAATTCIFNDFIQFSSYKINMDESGAETQALVDQVEFASTPLLELPQGSSHSGAKAVRMSKAVTVFVGLLSIGFAICAKFIGQSISLMCNAAQGMCNGPAFGVFLLGMLTVRVRASDAAISFTVAVTVMLYCILSQLLCPDESNSANGGEKASTLRPLCHTLLLPGRVSEWWYGAVGSLVVVLVGYSLSFVGPPVVLDQGKCRVPAGKVSERKGGA